MAHEKKLVIGNWKMNLDIQESSVLVHKLTEMVKIRRNTEVVLAPSLFTLQSLSLQINRRQFKLAAQNFYWKDQGDYTGEVSIAQLRGIASYGLVGVSERRLLFGETDRDIREKVQAALRSGIRPVLCVGDTMFDRTNSESHEVLVDQVTNGLANVAKEDVAKCVIAYEPIWANSSMEIVPPQDVKRNINVIRQRIKYLFGTEASQQLQILYAGLIDANLVAGYLESSGVDGLLLDEISLNPFEFSEIIEKVHQIT